MHFHNAISHFSLHSLHKCIYTFERISLIRTIRVRKKKEKFVQFVSLGFAAWLVQEFVFKNKRKMKAMYKSELAKLAGVSPRTFRRYLATRRPILTAMGVSPFARKLPPPAVRYISEDYCIDIPPCAAIKNIIRRIFYLAQAA